jgi:germination protein M
MAKRTFDPALKKKYPPRDEKSTGKEKKPGRNLGLLSLFFILLSLVLIVGKLTLEGRLSLGPAEHSSQTPVVSRIESEETLKAQKAADPSTEEQPSPLLNEDSLTREEPVPVKPETPPQKEYQARLFFLKINDEGQILLKSIIRTISYEEGLLSATLDTLLTGPSQDDLMKGYFTLIPEGTVIHRVTLKDGIAHIDVNDAFRYNHLGFEGYQAQLKQLVYSATEFSSVKGVKLTINGASEEFLSAEGVSIGEILTRESF